MRVENAYIISKMISLCVGNKNVEVVHISKNTMVTEKSLVELHYRHL